jgi:hypothetical protein
MRKIDLTPYPVKVRNEKGEISGEMPYNIRESMATVLFAPGQDLSVRESIKRAKLADRLENEKDGFILLEENEYDMLTKAVDVLKDVRRDDLQFIERILEAERISMKLVEKEVEKENEA